MSDNLYLALATDQDDGLDEDVRRAFYFVLAESEAEAAAIIRRARLSNSAIEFRDHEFPVGEAIEFFKLRHGVAHLLIAPKPEVPPNADYLFGEPALESQQEQAVLDIMRGDPKRLSLLRQRMAANQGAPTDSEPEGMHPVVVKLRVDTK